MTWAGVETGRAELWRALRRQSGLLWAIAGFSAALNLLALTGPLYMLQVYDRVLSSRSEATLIALSGLVVFLFAGMGVLDMARARLTGRVGARLQDSLDRRVFDAALRAARVAPGDLSAATAQRDLDALQRLWASPALTALADLPWAALFLAAIFVFHPLLGWAAVLGGGALVAVTALHHLVTGTRIARAGAAAQAAEAMADQIHQDSEALQALGMAQTSFGRWQAARAASLVAGLGALDRSAGFAALTRSLRLLLQSAMLGLGALLVLREALSPGAMIAASILLGRALAPVETAIGHWGTILRARDGAQRLAGLLARHPPEPARTALPAPKALLEAQALTVVPPGGSAPVLRHLTFRLEPGQALGVIGPSGAGKSSLARAIVGAWAPSGGSLRLDGAALDHYGPQDLGRAIGYLPQRITLFAGTIAENIARLSPGAEASAIVAAAQLAAAHEMILQLPDGYDTRISAFGGQLSGGQLQRIGLARALYGDPALLVLDEPNSNLDNEGSQALNRAIRALKDRGRAVLIMAHRPAAIQECDLLLVLEDGQRRAFGPRDAVLREMVKNHTQIVPGASAGAAP